MNTRILLTSALVAVAAASQAAITFSTLRAETKGSVGGTVAFTPSTNGNVLAATVNRTAGSGQPYALNLDVIASSNSGNIAGVTYDLYFLASGTNTNSRLKGTFTYNPILAGGGPGGTNVDAAGGVQVLTNSQGSLYPILPSQTNGLGTLVTLSGVNYYKVSRSLDLTSFNENEFHFVLDDAFRNTTLSFVDITVNPVPEPASMAALAIGGFGLLRRRRKA